MRKEIVRITTYDTEKTYEFPSEDNPRLFEVSMRIRPIHAGGNATGSYQYEHINHGMYIELETLLAAGMKPYERKPKENDPPATETPEDLMLRLLEIVGVYPQE